MISAMVSGVQAQEATAGQIACQREMLWQQITGYGV